MPFSAVGDGPIEFTDSSGRQFVIPLSALEFDDSNNLTANAWPGYTAHKAELDPYLKYLLKEGFIQRGSSSPQKQAMVVKAADPGSAGNNLQIAFTNIKPDPGDPTNAAKTTFDAVISEQETYSLLGIDSSNPNFLKTVLGTETITGSQPGAVHALDADTPKLPKAGEYTLSGGGNTTPSSVKIPANSSGDAFNLAARKNGADGDNTKVVISNVDTTANTFSMDVTWSKTITGTKVGDLPAKLQDTGYAIQVDAPDGGGFALPAAGTYGLHGGAEAQAAQAAQAVIIAGQ